MHKKTAVLLLSVLKKYKKIRAYKLQAFLMSKGVGGIYYYNHIRRFEKEGIIYRKKKMVKNVPYVFVYLNPDVDIDAIIESINNDSLYTNYETFKRHLIPFLEENKIVRKKIMNKKNHPMVDLLYPIVIVIDQHFLNSSRYRFIQNTL